MSCTSWKFQLRKAFFGVVHLQASTGCESLSSFAMMVVDDQQDNRFGGLVAAQAYKAYEDQFFLDHAIATWEDYNTWLITPADIARGSHPPQRGTLVKTCNGGK